MHKTFLFYPIKNSTGHITQRDQPHGCLFVNFFFLSSIPNLNIRKCRTISKQMLMNGKENSKVKSMGESGSKRASKVNRTSKSRAIQGPCQAKLETWGASKAKD